jgi:hypothetical protein
VELLVAVVAVSEGSAVKLGRWLLVVRFSFEFMKYPSRSFASIYCVGESADCSSQK